MKKLNFLILTLLGSFLMFGLAGCEALEDKLDNNDDEIIDGANDVFTFDIFGGPYQAERKKYTDLGSDQFSVRGYYDYETEAGQVPDMFLFNIGRNATLNDTLKVSHSTDEDVDASFVIYDPIKVSTSRGSSYVYGWLILTRNDEEFVEGNFEVEYEHSFTKDTIAVTNGFFKLQKYLR